MGWAVPLFDPDLGEEEILAVTEVIRSKWLTMGERVGEFERRFAELIGVRHAVAMSSATSALHLALLAAGVKPGDDVVCPSLTFVATANAIRYCGARPVFADITSLDDWNLSWSSIEEALTERTRAIMVVHYAGYPCDMATILAGARERGLAVVEDAAHAPGATRDGHAAGAWGDAGCFSFFSNKNLTTGEGGMLTTNRADIAETARSLRSHAMTSLTLERHAGHAYSYDVMGLGFNYRMSELGAALGLAQLRHLRERNQQRKALVALYRECLEPIEELGIPFSDHSGHPAFHIMPVLLPDRVDRERVMDSLRAAGIQSSIHYPPVDGFTAYREAGFGPLARLTNTHTVGSRALTLPLFPGLTPEQLALVCATLGTALSNS